MSEENGIERIGTELPPVSRGGKGRSAKHIDTLRSLMGDPGVWYKIATGKGVSGLPTGWKRSADAGYAYSEFDMSKFEFRQRTIDGEVALLGRFNAEPVKEPTKSTK